MQFVNRGIFDARGVLLEIQSVGRPAGVTYRLAPGLNPPSWPGTDPDANDPLVGLIDLQDTAIDRCPRLVGDDFTMGYGADLVGKEGRIPEFAFPEPLRQGRGLGDVVGPTPWCSSLQRRYFY